MKEDIFKLSLELQLMLKQLIANKYDNFVVYVVIGQGKIMCQYRKEQTANFLKSGFDFDVYKMELVTPLLYLMIKMHSFYLPRSLYDVATALSAIPTLLQSKEFTCNKICKARKNGLSSDSMKSDWARNPLIK